MPIIRKRKATIRAKQRKQIDMNVWETNRVVYKYDRISPYVWEFARTKGSIVQHGHASSDFCFSASCRTDEQNIPRSHFLFELVRKLHTTPSITHGDRHGFFGIFLSDDVLVQLFHNFTGTQIIIQGFERGRFGFHHFGWFRRRVFCDIGHRRSKTSQTSAGRTIEGRNLRSGSSSSARSTCGNAETVWNHTRGRKNLYTSRTVATTFRCSSRCCCQPERISSCVVVSHCRLIDDPVVSLLFRSLDFEHIF